MFCSNCGKFFEGNSELCPDCENAKANANDFTTSVQDADASAFESVGSSAVSEIQATAKTANVLGIVSLVTGILVFCCGCISSLAALITGIICLVKKAPEVDISTLSEEELAAYNAAQATIKRSKIFAIVGIVLSVVAGIVNAGLGALIGIGMSEGMYY